MASPITTSPIAVAPSTPHGHRRRRTPRQTILIGFSYRGERFHGVQPQPGLETVGGHLLARAALAFHQEPSGVSFAARTDAGVSAVCNYVSFYVRDVIDLADSAQRLSAADWPDGLQLLSIMYVVNPIQVRNCAVLKRYEYRIIDDLVVAGSAQLHDAWRLERSLDVTAMQRAAGLLEGRQDFASFRAANCSAKTTCRQLERLSVERRLGGITIFAEGSGFLRRMVRILVGTLVEVGLGDRKAEDMPQLLAQKSRDCAGSTAPAHGLTLLEVSLQLPAVRPLLAAAV